MIGRTRVVVHLWPYTCGRKPVVVHLWSYHKGSRPCRLGYRDIDYEALQRITRTLCSCDPRYLQLRTTEQTSILDGLYWTILVYIGLHWSILVYIGLYSLILDSTVSGRRKESVRGFEFQNCAVS